MEIIIGKSLKNKGAAEAKKVLQKRYLDPKGPYIKLVEEKKAQKVTQEHIDSAIEKAFDLEKESPKTDPNADSKGTEQSGKASQKKG